MTMYEVKLVLESTFHICHSRILVDRVYSLNDTDRDMLTLKELGIGQTTNNLLFEASKADGRGLFSNNRGLKSNIRRVFDSLFDILSDT